MAVEKEEAQCGVEGVCEEGCCSKWEIMEKGCWATVPEGKRSNKSGVARAERRQRSFESYNKFKEVEDKEEVVEEGVEEYDSREWVRELCPVETRGQMLKVGFQVAGVSKPLLSVRRVVDKGNKVSFGPGRKDNFIENIRSADKVFLRPTDKGSYFLDAKMGGKKIEITVDSGAEENVCPEEFGKKEFGTNESEEKMRFRGAGGDPIEQYGKRDVTMEALF